MKKIDGLVEDNGRLTENIETLTNQNLAYNAEKFNFKVEIDSLTKMIEELKISNGRKDKDNGVLQ